MTVLKLEGQKYKKIKLFKKGATINTGCGVKNQRSQSEMRTIPIYHLSQSGMRLIKLL
jgi:hypothetical protein